MKQNTQIRLISMLVCVAAIPGYAAAATYSFQLVSYPADNFTNLLGINNSATIAGFHGAAVAQGFTLTLPGSFAIQNYPLSTQTMVVGINNLGSTAGIYTDSTGFTHGYTDIGGAFHTVDAPGTIFNQALGINDSNTTVGYFAADQAGQTGQQAYTQSGGSFVNINGLLPSNQNSQATGINNAGTVVGFYLPTGTTSIGFLDQNNTITTIDPFGSLFTQALGISSNGEIVGFYVDGIGAQHGYTDINGVFTSIDPPGSINTTINGVNSHGQIVGFETRADDSVVGFVGTPTPEPGSLVLIGGALIAMGLFRGRRIRLRVFGAAIIALSIFGAHQASAAIIQADYQTKGDGLVTLDTITGFKWLDAPVTMGESPNQATGANPGYKLATISQVTVLLEDAGIPAGHINTDVYYISDQAAMDTLAQLLRLTDVWVQYYGAAASGWEYQQFVNLLGSSGNGWGEEMLDVRNPPLGGQGAASQLFDFSNCFACSAGNNFDFLVNTSAAATAAPEPASFAFVTVALAALGLLRRRGFDFY